MIDEKRLIESIKNKQITITGLRSWKTWTAGFVESRNKIIHNIIEIINEQPRINKWIPVEKGLPEEKERIESVSSDLVLVTVKGCNENEYYVTTDYTVDGEWNIEMTTGFYKVTAWMPLPQRYEKELENELL